MKKWLDCLVFSETLVPGLNMPNTTNSLDGFFSQMKKLLRVHTGLSEERRNKIVSEVLNGEDGTKTKEISSRKYH